MKHRMQIVVLFDQEYETLPPSVMLDTDNDDGEMELGAGLIRELGHNLFVDAEGINTGDPRYGEVYGLRVTNISHTYQCPCKAQAKAE